jgi:endonuclease/exonuclease/phosphatase family metal-dependent hydrolase
MRIALLLAMTGCMVGEFDDGSDDEITTFAGKNQAQLKVVTHNIEKKGGAMDNATGVNGADVVALQEVCPDQLARLHRDHDARWTIREVSQKRAPNVGCDGQVPFTVIIWTGGTGGTLDVANDRIGGAFPDAPGVYVCINFPKGGVTAHACSAHLVSSKWTDAAGVEHAGDDIRLTQTRELTNRAASWIGAGHFVILAGDFNGQPDTKPLDQLYVPALQNGKGQFTEYNRNGGTREGQTTAATSGENSGGTVFEKKIDYIFYSRNRAPLNGPAVDIRPDAADHDMVISTVAMEKG